jgi:ABC-2 type transport system permease protein
MRYATVVASIAWKDFSIWLRRPVAILTTMTPTIMYVLVVYYISIDVGTPPIAVVAPIQGPASPRLESVLRNDGGFRADVMSAGEARHELSDMQVAAVVTVPPGLQPASAAVGTRTPLPVAIKMNNLNEDIANDLRRSLALSINSYNRETGTRVPVTVDERDTYHQDISLAQFRLLPGLVLILTIAGIVNTGLATCQEFEAKTFKELVLAPTSTWALVGGKIIGGWLTTLMIAAFIWIIGLVTGLIAPTGAYLVPALVMSAVVGLAAACIGVAMGAALRQFQLVTSLSVMVALYLFFAAGGVSVFGFLPHLLQSVTTYDPLYYAIHALVESVLVSSLHDYLRDVAVMLAFALAGAGLSTAVLRRRVTA